MTLHINPTQAVLVTAYEYGPEQVDPETGETYRPVIGVKPGVRLDVQITTIERHPALMWGYVEPANPVHDCGPTGVRLIAESMAVFEAAAPATGHHHDLFWDDVA